MPAKVLHLLSQRPSLTGSGVTLDSLVRLAGDTGWKQEVVVGTPVDDPAPDVGGLNRKHIHPLLFGTETLPFKVPGMSDVMPYASTRFSSMSQAQLDTYRDAWRSHLRPIVDDFAPDVIHCHHAWILASLVKEIAPVIPVICHGHGTGLRQMQLCPESAEAVRSGCATVNRFAVLHQEHATQYAHALGLPADRFHIVGAGYRQDLFHSRGRPERTGHSILYAGKYSHAKGLPWLLDAVDRLQRRYPKLQLHLAGGGSSEEADALRARLDATPYAAQHGQLGQAELADLMRQCSLFVLPSFYEGLPLVLVEALACGCRLVSTALPGVVNELSPHFGEALELVAPPGLVGSDLPVEQDLPAFVDRLAAALEGALRAAPLAPGSLSRSLEHFTWSTVFARVEQLWLDSMSADNQVAWPHFQR